MSTQHTAGPWHWDAKVWDYDPENDAPWLVDAADKRVLWGGIKCDSEADARLIAAAPELFEACKEMNARLLRCMASGLSAHDAYDSFYQVVVQEAIAKATGSAA